MPLFRLLLEWDLVGASAGYGGGFPGTYDNGMLGYRRGPRFDALLASWAAIQRRIDQVGDDQHTLSRALREHPGFRTALVGPSWHVKLFPASLSARRRKDATAAGVGPPPGGGDHTRSVMTTLVVHGQARLMAAWVGPEEDRRALCRFLNRRRRPRVFVLDATVSPPQWAIAYSQRECDALTGGLCDHPEVDWARPPEAQPFIEYVSRHLEAPPPPQQPPPLLLPPPPPLPHLRG